MSTDSSTLQAPPSQRNLNAALAYASRGLPVFPLHDPTEGGCSCGSPDCSSPGKHPRTVDGVKAATTDAEQLAAWWSKWPRANIGLATGELVVFDLDGAEAIEAFRDLFRDHDARDDAFTTIVTTGSGGLHFYYRLSEGSEPVRNSASRIGPGIDVRGEGGYVLAPPSLHPSGREYVTSRRSAPLSLPGWLRDLAVGPPPAPPAPPVAPPTHRDGTRYGLAALADQVSRVESAGKGGRNHTLNAAAYILGRVVGGGGLVEDVARDQLLAAALRCGLRQTEALQTIDSGLTAGILNPRHVPDR